MNLAVPTETAQVRQLRGSFQERLEAFSEETSQPLSEISIAVELGHIGCKNQRSEAGDGREEISELFHRSAKMNRRDFFVGIDVEKAINPEFYPNTSELDIDFHQGLKVFKNETISGLSSNMSLGMHTRDGSMVWGAPNDGVIAYTTLVLDEAERKLKPGSAVHIVIENSSYEQLLRPALELSNFSQQKVTVEAVPRDERSYFVGYFERRGYHSVKVSFAKR